jgi:MFS family permease
VSPILTDNPLFRATATNFFFFLSMNGFILLPLYIAALGGTEIEIGLVMALYNAVGIVCQPLIGLWTDAVGRKPFMLVGVALVIFAALLATVAPWIPLLAAVRVLQGLGFSFFFVSNYSFVIDLVPPARRGWALSIYGVAGLSATAVAPLLGEWVIRRHGFRALFTMAAAAAAVAGWIALCVREQRRERARPIHGLLWGRAALGEVGSLGMAVTGFFGLGTGTIFVFLPTFAESLGVETLALFYTAFALAAIGVRVFGGRLIDTRGRRAVIVPSMLVQTIATALLAVMGFLVTRTSQTPVLPVLFLAGLLSGGAHGFLYPGLAALVTDQTPADRRGGVVGIFSSVFLTGQTAGALVFGFVTHGVGYAFMWMILTSLLFAGFALSLKLARV